MDLAADAATVILTVEGDAGAGVEAAVVVAPLGKRRARTGTATGDWNGSRKTSWIVAS